MEPLQDDVVGFAVEEAVVDLLAEGLGQMADSSGVVHRVKKSKSKLQNSEKIQIPTSNADWR